MIDKNTPENWEQLLIDSAKNEHYANRYIKFINDKIKQKRSRVKGHHTHHILPRSIFPEYKKSKWNLVVLTPREHFLSHWMLSKSHGGSMIHAFYQMAIHPKYNIRVTSTQYQKIKILFAEDLSSRKFYMVAGRIRRLKADDSMVLSGEAVPCPPNYTKRKCNAKPMLGRVAVYDAVECKKLSVKLEDVDYVRYVPIGVMRDQSSRNKTSDALKGRIAAYDPVARTQRYFKTIKEIPVDYVLGLLGSSERAKQTFKNARHAHNKKTGEHIRTSASELPDGFEWGKPDGSKNFFKDTVILHNPFTGGKLSIKSTEIPPKHYGVSGTTYVYTYQCGDDRMASFSGKRLISMSGVKIHPCYILSTADLDFVFKRGSNKGSSPKTLGFNRTPVSDWDYLGDDWDWV